MAAMEEALSAEIEFDDDFDTRPVPVLLLTDRRFRFDWLRGEFSVRGVALRVLEAPNRDAGTGFVVWDGAVVLAKYLERHSDTLVAGRRVVEVGAGTGLVGLAAWALQARQVVLTDLPYCLDNLRATAAANEPASATEGVADTGEDETAGRKVCAEGAREADSARRPEGAIEVAALDWHAPEPPAEAPDLVVGADVVWVPELIAPLVRTLEVLTDPARTDGRLVPVLLGHQTRSRESDRLLFALLDHRFHVRRVPWDDLHPDFRDPALHVLRLERRECV